jgi:methyl-accepting chemotaxis protein
VKKTQSLKLRFIVLFSIFLITLCAVTSVSSIRNISTVASNIFAAQGESVIKRAAALIDGDSFEALAHSLDIDDPYYEKTRLELFALKESSNCVYLYTMAPAEGTVWRFIIDGSAPPDDAENFSSLGDEEDIAEYDKAFFETLATGTLRHGTPDMQERWGWVISSYMPIKNSAGVPVGIVGIDFLAEELIQNIRAKIVEQIVLCAIFVTLGICLLLLLLRMIFSNLKNINVILKEISEGEGDLTRRIKVTRHDEIGELASYFNLTLEKIKTLVVIIKNQTVELLEMGRYLSADMEETASAVQEMTANIQNITGKIVNQSASVTQTGATMEQVTQNIGRLDDQVMEQSRSVDRSSSAIEQMLANINSVTQTLGKNVENVRMLTEAAEAGRGGLEGVSRNIGEIAQESEGLLQINSVVQNISSQTNLLAMNAAIEAAHAGEAGKGFAVVADEIRKLAENSGKQSKTISRVLKKIKDSIDTITASANAVLFQFRTIDDKVQIVSEQESTIRNAMEEQSQGGREILESVARLNEITQTVKQGSTEMLTGSKEVIGESKNLERLSEEITGGMTEMSIGVEQIIAAVNRVNDLSTNNREHINKLADEVSRFKVT